MELGLPQSDPFELKNVYSDPANAATKKDLAGELDRLRQTVAAAEAV